MNPSVEVQHLVGKLSTAETLLPEVRQKIATCPGKHLFVIRERIMLNLYVCTSTENYMCIKWGMVVKGLIRKVEKYVLILVLKLSPCSKCKLFLFG